MAKILNVLLFAFLINLSLFSAEKLKNAILDKKSSDKIWQIYESELFCDVSFTESKPIKFFAKMHEELISYDLSDDLLEDFKQRQCAFFCRVQKLDPTIKREDFLCEIEACYADFISRFLIENKPAFSKILFETLAKKEGELPYFFAYVFGMEISKDNRGKNNIYKRFSFVPTLICLKTKKENQRLLILTEDRVGTCTEFFTFLLKGKRIKKIIKMKHHFNEEELSSHKRDIVLENFKKRYVFSSWEGQHLKETPGFLYKWDDENQILSVIDQGTENYIHHFELIGDTWHFVD
ncbi:MAG: hypothetical protein HEEMFOPI_00373 [Holosporales bacterium]